MIDLTLLYSTSRSNQELREFVIYFVLECCLCFSIDMFVKLILFVSELVCYTFSFISSIFGGCFFVLSKVALVSNIIGSRIFKDFGPKHNKQYVFLSFVHKTYYILQNEYAFIFAYCGLFM